MDGEARQMDEGDSGRLGIISSPGWEGVVQRQYDQDHQREVLGLPQAINIKWRCYYIY